MHGLLSVFLGGRIPIRVLILIVASVSENVCILIEIAGRRPCQDICFLFSNFFPGWWLWVLRVFVEQSSIPYGCRCGWITVSGPSEKYWDAEDDWKSSLHVPLYTAHTFDWEPFCRRTTKKSNKLFCFGTMKGKSPLQICYIDTGANVLNSTSF